jgi:hypothetical protein
MSLDSLMGDIVHDPFLMPDIEKAVSRIFDAQHR